ncbi:hypothetical protein [Streptomyces nigrescens]|uniref:hypothetical protein n=1 Tax=Streptomyces nigrescens TaxID=1920 RepID=UPI0022512801|nr:hypothetical protein [Streptomyces libani]MCX5445983.1 hypothetical protein [Streptomyces libani]
MTAPVIREALAGALQSRRPDVYRGQQHSIDRDAIADAEALLADLAVEGWAITHDDTTTDTTAAP